jgi:putative transposase
MADMAVHMEQEVFPEAPVRQWVCSLPWGLRALLGYDRKLCADVLAGFVKEVSGSLKRRGKSQLGLKSVRDAHTGAVTVVQREDSALRLNVHFHSLLLDGVYVRNPATRKLVFHALPPPTAEEVEDVARRTAVRTKKTLEKHGRSLDLGEDDDGLGITEPALAACYSAAAAGLGLTGERAGRPILRLVAQERLAVHPSGKLRYSMKKPWSDGTVAMIFEPEDLLSRICALIPPPRWHTVRYFGVLSSHAARRKEVVPAPPAAAGNASGKQLALLDEVQDDETAPPRKPWAWLLRHVFQLDLTTCPTCGGQMRLLETATTSLDFSANK